MLDFIWSILKECFESVFAFYWFKIFSLWVLFTLDHYHQWTLTWLWARVLCSSTLHLIDDSEMLYSPDGAALHPSCSKLLPLVFQPRLWNIAPHLHSSSHTCRRRIPPTIIPHVRLNDTTTQDCQNGEQGANHIPRPPHLPVPVIVSLSLIITSHPASDSTLVASLFVNIVANSVYSVCKN